MVATLVAIPTSEPSERPGTLFLINTTFNDMQLYSNSTLCMHLNWLAPFSPIPLDQPQAQAGLLHYCKWECSVSCWRALKWLSLIKVQNTAYRSFATCGETTGQIRDALMTMAMASNRRQASLFVTHCRVTLRSTVRDSTRTP